MVTDILILLTLLQCVYLAEQVILAYVLYFFQLPNVTVEGRIHLRLTAGSFFKKPTEE